MRATRTTRFKLKRLGAELRRLRSDTGLTMREVAEQIGCAASKISRQEAGQAGIRPAELDRLLGLYGVAPTSRDELRALLGDEQVRDWWVRYEDVLAPSQFTYLAMENEASTMHEYQPTNVPGLLQTRAYARAINMETLRPLDADQIEATVEVRLRRQRRLIDDPRLDLRVVLWEGSLAFETGGRAVMRDQLQHLIAVSASPNVTLRIVPFAAGRAGVLVSPFQVMRFPSDRDHDQVFIESLKGTLLTGSDHEIAQCARLFERVNNVALDPRGSVELLATRAKDL